jgi:nitrogen regulatory protein PII-like uncharacterized protein
VTSTLTPDLDEPRIRRRITVGRVLAIMVVVGLVGFWIYAFSPLAPDQKADGLADDAFVGAANARCKAATQAIDALPAAKDSATPADRAVVVDQGTAIVASMVTELRAQTANATGRDRELLDQWFADWDTYVASRQRYADQLRGNDEGALFTVPARNGGQITETMDGFSRTNSLYDCLVPLDV